MPETKKPSLIGCFLIVEKITSTKPPAVYETKTIGSTTFEPTIIFSKNDAEFPIAIKCW